MLSGDMNGLYNGKKSALGADAGADDADVADVDSELGEEKIDEFLDFGKKAVVDEIEIDLGNQPLANGANVLNGNQDTLSGDMNGL